MSKFVTSADIEDGKVEYDAKTGIKVEYRKLDGGYEVITTTPQPNGTLKTQVQTYWDPKPVSEEDLKKEKENRKQAAKRMGKEIRIDEHTTMLTRAIEGGYEEVYTTVNADGTKSSRTKTFFDSVPADQLDQLKSNMDKSIKKSSSNKNKTTSNTDINTNTNTNTSLNYDNKTRKTITRNASTESVESSESRHVSNQKKSVFKSLKDNKLNYSEESLVEESHRISQNIEITENNRTVRKNSLQEQSIKAVSQFNTSGGTNADGSTKKKRKPKLAAPPPPADFPQNETTTVVANRVSGGTEYTYSTKLESGKTVTVTKRVYEEEETELTEEETQAYKKILKDAEKHKNITQPKRLKSESGTKKVMPTEKEGEVTTVETISVEGGTQYHYTTVTADGIVKKTVKTVYDSVSVANGEESEEEFVEEIEEEIIEPSEKITRMIESIEKLPKKFSEEVTITSEKKEKKTKKSIIASY